MTPAVEWLEALTDDERLALFRPQVCGTGAIAQIKLDHEKVTTAGWCPWCGRFEENLALVIE